MSYDDFLAQPPYSLSDDFKTPLLKDALRTAFAHHFQGSEHYRRFCEKAGWVPPVGDFEYADFPYLPTEIFKQLRLASVPDSEIVRALQSSGTSSQTPSTVVIDNVTRTRQVRTLMWLLGDYLGQERRPFVIMDVDPSLIPPSQHTITARTAAIRGFLPAASTASYCMNMAQDGAVAIDIDKLAEDLSGVQARNERAVLFGYTYVLSQYVAKELNKRGVSFSLPEATILHIGGWKKLQSQAVSKPAFNEALEEVFGVPQGQIVDVYGFTEQLGLVYMDCEAGLKHCPSVAEIVIRDPRTLEPVADGRDGMVELITPLPHSYPGLAILLDDIGRVVSRGTCSCGRHGTAFEIVGRASEAEIRGCGDVLAENFAGVL
jgi:hypothetical protein